MIIASFFEDEDDLHLVGQITRSLGLPDIKDEPVRLKGYDPTKLRNRLSNKVKGEWDRLVIVLDADRAPDGGPTRRWQEVRAALRAAGIDIPDGLNTSNGLLHDLPGDRRIAVWLFPDCQSEGAMEDFVLQRLVPVGDALLAHAETVVDALPEKRFPQKDLQKARMRSWLSWQKRPGSPPGQAVSEKTLKVDEARIGAFASWLRGAIGP